MARRLGPLLVPGASGTGEGVRPGGSDREERRLLFKNGPLAAALSEAADTAYDARTLPFETFDLLEDEEVIRFEVDDREFRCDIVRYECEVAEAPERRRHTVASPDSTWEVFARDHDLYARPFGGGDAIRLTTDGEEHWAYGLGAPSVSGMRSDRERRPNVEWSPDSRRVAVPRVDEREVEHMPLYSSTERRPEVYTYPYALPGDSVVPRPHYYVISVPEGEKRKAELDPKLVRGGFAEGVGSTWSGDGEAFRLLLFTRGYDDKRLLEVEVGTAEVRELAREESPTFVNPALGPHRDDENWSVVGAGNGVVWYSQRDGWPHLYRLGGDGELRNRITGGEWAVARLHHVDEEAGEIYLTAWGREDGPHPYHENLYRVGLYPGPQMGSVRSWGFTLEYWAARSQALAELGFVVVTLDHTGTPMRSKAFHDSYYGNLGDNGIPDHVAALRQLGARHRWMDVDRVGIYGNSGGGFASTRAIFEYPDVCHVAVSAAGNHDNRTYSFTWGEKCHGPFEQNPKRGDDSYEIQANPPLAENLEGELLLIHGDLDDNVHPAMTLQVVEAPVEANQGFDLLLLPDRGHSMREPYVIRRPWDYFVEHLFDREPPDRYQIYAPNH